MSKGEFPASSREFSKTVFSKGDRLQIWGAIAEYSVDPPERFSFLEALEKSGSKYATVSNELHVLRGLGMIAYENGEGYPGNVTHWFVRTDSPVWRIVDTAVEVVDVLYPEETEDV